MFKTAYRLAIPTLLLCSASVFAADPPASAPERIISFQPMPKVGVPGAPPVIAPPEAIFAKMRDRDRDVGKAFYKKYIDVKGLSLMASGEVSDLALQRTYDIVTHMLAGRPDILASMGAAGTRLIIIGKDQVYTDMPEYRNSPNPTYQNERVRGTGGLDVTSFGEENLLNLPLDRYDDESIGVHEFCHTVDAAISRIDPTWRGWLRATFQNAITNNLWHYAYTGSNQAEYWAEICQSYFDNNRVNNWNHAAVPNREMLKEYDPVGYELVRSTFNLTPQQDWRYTAMQKEPCVFPPPAKFHIDPYYTKFTWAREFNVVGSNKVSDEALLKANDTVRKLFAYRHDILKVFINDGAKLVVLGPGETLADLPEFKDSATKAGFDNVRYLEYSPALKTLVVPQENVLGIPKDPFRGECMVVNLFAKGMVTLTASRPVDDAFEKLNNGGKQQYELHVQRMDTRFGDRLDKAYKAAMDKKLWLGTAAARDRTEYWAAGVEAYFDAAGEGHPAREAHRPITTREALQAYDADLYAIIDEVFAYQEHADWTYKPYEPPVSMNLAP